MSNWTAQKSYKYVALPFGVYMLLTGPALCVMTSLMSDFYLSMQPVISVGTKRIAFLVIGTWIFFMGIGFLKRQVWALYSFLVYIIAGCFAHVGLALIDPDSHWALYSPLFILPFGAAIYFATRRAFIPTERV